MKFILVLFGLAGLAAAIPGHFQGTPSVLCTNVPAKTVTVTDYADCGAEASTTMITAPNVASTPTTVTLAATGILVSNSVKANSGIASSSMYSTVNPSSATKTTHATLDCSTTIATSAPGAIQTHKIDVGAFIDPDAPDGQVFQFRPNNVSALIGDVVEFNMLAANHSVTQSDFAQPCVQIDNGFGSGFQVNLDNSTNLIVESFTVGDDSPLWFYCRQDTPIGHCGTGMVFGINPTSNEQMDQFVAMAIAQNATSPIIGRKSQTACSSSPVVTRTADMRFHRN